MIAEPLVNATETENLSNPFPGLRPFEFHENDLFFGREGQSEALLIKLSKTHFLAVVGTSGSGKSSLVRAGLLPALYGGLMGKDGSGWRIAILRPGNDPIFNLAVALNQSGALEQEDEKSQYVQTQVTLRRGSRGLVEAVRQARLEPHENLLILVDQFEELFRFARISEDEEYANNAAAFVKLLLEARRQENIYVVLTMRSDYLGDCAQFWDLPEAINEGQYLIPRMTREERREAIEGPLGVRGIKGTPGLINQLLNDIGDSPDQLPILQHALMRIWEQWREEDDKTAPLDLRHYEKRGGITKTLSLHADEAYAELPDERSREVAEKLFKCLTEKGTDERETRRPTELGKICLIAGASEEEVIAVINVFRREGRSFLMPAEHVALESSTSIDISHESLIRNWEKLKKWVDEEAYSGRLYRRLAEDAIYRRAEGLLRDPGLQETLDWREKNNPNEAWASRHHTGFCRRPEFAKKAKEACDEEIFKRAMDFLDESERKREDEKKKEEERQQKELAQARRAAAEKEQQRRKELRQAQRFAAVLGIAFIIISSLAVYAFIKRNQAKAEKTKAEDLKNKAEERSKTISLLNYRSTMNLAQKAYQDGKFGEANELLSRFLPTPPQEDLRQWDWYYLWRALHNERRTLHGHSEKITSVALSPDSQTIATGSLDKKIGLWNVSTGKQLHGFLEEHQDTVSSLSFAPDGKTLASGSADGKVKLWDISTGKMIKEQDTKERVTSVGFDRNSNRLAIGLRNGSVRVWDTAAPPGSREMSQASVKSQDIVWSVAFSPDGRTVVSGGNDGTVKLWNADTGQLAGTLNALSELKSEPPVTPNADPFFNAVLSVTFSPNGKNIAASTNRFIKIWDMDSRKLKATLGQQESSDERASPAALSLAFRDDNTLISGNADSTVRLWDINEPKEPRVLKGHSEEVLSVAFSADGKTIVTGSADKTAKLWDESPQPEVTRLPSLTGKVYVVAFSPPPEDKIIVSGSDNGVIQTWDLNTHHVSASRQGHDARILSVAVSAERVIATGSADTTVKLWRADTLEPIGKPLEHKATVTSVAFSRDGKTLATGSEDQTVKLWKTDTGELLKTLEGHSGKVWSVAFSRDGKTLATANDNKTINLWKTDTGELLKTLEGHLGPVLKVAFSPVGELLASGSADYTAKIWHVNTNSEPMTFSGHKSAVLSVAFSPDGRRLITGGDDGDGDVRFWDTSSISLESVGQQELAMLAGQQKLATLMGQQELAMLMSDPSAVLSLAFAPDGLTIAAGRESGSMFLWHAASPEQVAAQR